MVAWLDEGGRYRLGTSGEGFDVRGVGEGHADRRADEEGVVVGREGESDGEEGEVMVG